MRRLTLIIFRSLFILIVVPILAFAVFLQTDFARNIAKDYLEQVIRDKTGGKISIDEVTWLSIRKISAKNIAFYQPQKKLGIMTERVEVQFSPFSLISKELNFPSIKMDGVRGENEEDIFSSSIDLTGNGTWSFNTNESFMELTLSLSDHKEVSVDVTLEANQDRFLLQLNGKEISKFIGSSYFPFSIDHAEVVFGGPISSLKEIDPTDASSIPLVGNFSMGGSTTTITGNPVKGNLSGVFSFENEIGWNIQKIQGFWGPCTISGSGRVTSNGIIDQTQLSIQSKELSTLLQNQVKGEFDAVLTVSGNIVSPYLSLTANAKNLTLYHQFIPVGHLRCKSYFTNGYLQGNIKLGVEIHDHPFELTSDYILQEWDKLKFTDLLLSSPNLIHARGNIKSILSQSILYGEFEGNIEDLSVWPSFFSVPSLNGKADFIAKLEKDGKFDATLHGSNLHHQSFKCESGKLTLAFSNLFSVPKGEAKLSLNHVIMNELEFDTIDTQVSITDSFHLLPFKLIANTHKKLNSSFQMEGILTPDYEVVTADIHTFEGKWSNLSFNLANPVYFQYKKNAFTLSPMLFLIDKGSLYASLDVKNNHIHATLRTVDFPLEPLSSFIQEYPLQGLASIDAYLYGQQNELTGYFSLSLKQLILSEENFGKLPPLEANLQGSLCDQLLDTHGEVKGIGDQPMQLDAKIPLICNFTNITLLKNDPLKIQLNGSSELGPLLQLMQTNIASLTGKTNVQLEMNGTLSHPKFSGEVMLSNGKFESYELGTRLSQIQARFQGNGNEIDLVELVASDGKKGRILGTGKILFDATETLSYDFKVNFDRAEIVNLDNLKAICNGKLTVKGNLDKAIVEGKLESNSVSMTLPKNVSPSMKKIPVIYINESGDNKHATPEKNKPLINIEYDLSLIIPSKARVSDTNLSSEWKGELNITGSLEDPKLFGEFQLLEGKYQFQGKTFILEKGNVSFNGDFEKNATLYVVAAMEVDRTKIEAVLKGDLYDPQLTLRSNPSLSQREVLSLLLFGKAFSGSTPLAPESPATTNLSTTLTTGGDGEDMLSRFRNMLGIDRIDFSRQGSREMSVQVGKYIDNKTFITLKRNIRENHSNDGNTFGIERELTRNFKFQAEVGDDASSHFNLIWKRDY